MCYCICRYINKRNKKTTHNITKMDNFNPNTGTMGCPGPSQGCFQPFRNNYNNNPIGALQERFHRSQACYGNSNFDPLGWLEGSGLDSQFPEDGSEVGFGVYKADEFGEFKQVGFGQPKSCEAFGSFRDSSLKRDFGVLSEEYLVDSDGFQRYQEFDHPPGWGERFVSSQDQIGGFGSFRGGYGPGSVDFGQPPFARGMPRVAFGPRPGFVNNRHGPFGAHRGFFKVPRGVPSRRALRGGGRVFRGRGKAKVAICLCSSHGFYLERSI